MRRKKKKKEKRRSESLQGENEEKASSFICPSKERKDRILTKEEKKFAGTLRE